MSRVTHGSISLHDRMPGPNASFSSPPQTATAPGVSPPRPRWGSTTINFGSLRSVRAQRGPEEKVKQPKHMRLRNTRFAYVRLNLIAWVQSLQSLTTVLCALPDPKAAGNEGDTPRAAPPPPTWCYASSHVSKAARRVTKPYSFRSVLSRSAGRMRRLDGSVAFAERKRDSLSWLCFQY